MKVLVDFTDVGWEKFKQSYNSLCIVLLNFDEKIRRRAWADAYAFSYSENGILEVEISKYSTLSENSELVRDLGEGDFEWTDLPSDEEE